MRLNALGDNRLCLGMTIRPNRKMEGFDGPPCQYHRLCAVAENWWLLGRSGQPDFLLVTPMFKKVAGWHNRLVAFAAGARIIFLMRAATSIILDRLPFRSAKEGTRHGGGYPISGLGRPVTSACPCLLDSSETRCLPWRRVRRPEMRSDTRASGSCSVRAW
jgi:hypothetical protein